MLEITTPLDKQSLITLRAGTEVALSGRVFTGRDRTHQRFLKAIESGDDLPFDPRGQVLFYTGPTGSGDPGDLGVVGPTTASRLDKYTPLLLERGLIGMIGKGSRSSEVVNAIKQAGAVYFLAAGGAAAYLTQFIRGSSLVAFPELGPEAVYALDLDRLPLVVAVDPRGHDLFVEGPRRHRTN